MKKRRPVLDGQRRATLLPDDEMQRLRSELDLRVAEVRHRQQLVEHLSSQLAIANEAQKRADKERAELRRLLAAAQAQVRAAPGIAVVPCTTAPEIVEAFPDARRIGFATPHSTEES